MLSTKYFRCFFFVFFALRYISLILIKFSLYSKKKWWKQYSQLTLFSLIALDRSYDINHFYFFISRFTRDVCNHNISVDSPPKKQRTAKPFLYEVIIYAISFCSLKDVFKANVRVFVSVLELIILKKINIYSHV